MAEMKLCMVSVYTQNIVTQKIEQKMYCVQAESLGLIFECLEGLVKLKRGRPISMEQINAMTELGDLIGGK